MNTTAMGDSEDALRESHAWAVRHQPAATAHVVLQLGTTESALAWGSGAQTLQVSVLPLGLRVLAERHFPADRLDALAIETAIAEVEDIVMPWHRKLPAAACLSSRDAAIAELASYAGMPGDGPWRLPTEAVEDLFNRWTALAQGRPASQDSLPTTGEFSAALLVLREWLHHLGFDGITVCRPPAA